MPQARKLRFLTCTDADARCRVSSGIAAEKWASKVARLRRASPYGHLPCWRLRPVIVKSGDDCRQELMAVQIVSKLQAVFLDAGLPLWLRPFEVRTRAETVAGSRVQPPCRC